MTDVLRLGADQSASLIADGYDNTQELCFWSTSDVNVWCTSKTRLTANRGGVTFGMPRVKNIQAFAFWCTDMHQRGLPCDLSLFDNAMLLTYREVVRVEDARKTQTSSVDLPDLLGSTVIWEDWEKSLWNYLQAQDGINGIPLSYVMRPADRPAIDIVASNEQVRLQDLTFNAPFTGAAYNTDSEKVFGIIESLTLDCANRYLVVFFTKY